MQMQDAPAALVLFDGTCGFCDRTVNFIIDHDPKGRFHFAPLQSAVAQQILSQHSSKVADLASVVLVEDGKLYFRSTAALRILAQLSRPWSVLGRLIVVPLVIRDRVYDWIARNRYGWFGKVEACRVPAKDVAQRFISE